jgi:hypothetical protein
MTILQFSKAADAWTVYQSGMGQKSQRLVIIVVFKGLNEGFTGRPTGVG